MKTLTRNQILRTILALYAAALIVALGSLLTRSRFWEQISTQSKSGSVAVVKISGPIQTRMAGSGLSGGPDAEAIARRLYKISKDPTIKAVILRINSPGGTVGGVQEIYQGVLECKKKGKKVVASLGDVAASGGYYIAASADKIVTNPGTITGSIGVILQFGNLEGLFQKVGVRLQVIKSGEHKDIGSPARSLTPEEKQMLQASIDDAYAQFVDAVAQGRSLPREQIVPLADGRIFTGRQAMQAGLADELGGVHDALQVAIKLANLAPNPPIIRDDSKSFRVLLEELSSRLQVSSLWDSVGIPSSGFQLEYSLK
jgi:protease IV